MAYDCPHCGQPVVQGQEATLVICPSCYDIFPMPAASHWTLGVVAFLILQYFVVFLT